MNRAIEVEAISKRYELGRHKSGSLGDSLRHIFTRDRVEEDKEFWALKNISFQVNDGEALGIIGKNGAGKSTLLKTLSRITYPTSGVIKIFGRVSSLLEVGTGFHPELSGRENIYLNGTILGMRRAEVKSSFDEIVAFSGVDEFIDTPIKHYSSGMKVRLAFAVAAHLRSEVLIVDEVLAVGDAQFQKKSIGKMEEVTSEGRTVLIVSHNLGLIADLCSRGIVLEQGQLAFDGPIDTAIRHYNGQAVKDHKAFDDQIVKEIWLKQEADALVLNLKYSADFKIDLPNFGFSIRDVYGNVVTGSNPLKSRQDRKIGRKSGVVSVRMNSPKLSSGEYNLSFWFGDSRMNYFKDLDALRFSVTDMLPSNTRNHKFDGSVIPECDWIFE